MNLRVSLGKRSYAITVADSYRRLPTQLHAITPSREAWIISHQVLLRRHGRALVTPLQRAGWSVHTLAIPESERSKSFAMAQRIIRQLSRKATMRVPTLFAFGGGVVGDLTGFVAAIYRRGVPYVHLPTTLLAQVDSAVGGKVGVDLPEGKNLVGAFYQPRLVYNNVALLRTLPLRQRQSGLAEVIKYGAMGDRALFAFLEEHLDACLALEPRTVRVMVERSCRIKARIISRDERDTTGVRIHLNFGHTLGHALEAVTQYRRWTHGEAIAIGMCVAARLSYELGRCTSGDCARLAALIRAAGLPTEARGVARDAVLRVMQQDKKFIHGRPRWVLLETIGRVVATEEVPTSLVRQVVGGSIR